jgi:UDP-glucose 4-epimerase
VEHISGVNVPFVFGDVRDRGLLIDTIRAHSVTSVMHFAGLKAVGESVETPLHYYDANVGGSLSLIDAMMETSVRRLVFSSSATVYGMPQSLPISEDHPRQATSPYGRSKLMIEDILGDLCLSDPDWRVVSLRYFNPAGAHKSCLIGENPRGIPNNLMPYIMKVACGQLETLRVFGGDYETPDGSGVRDYIHVMDLVDGHLAALEFLNANSGHHAINLGTGRGVSVFQMIQEFEKASSQVIPFTIVGRRSGDVPICYADVNRASELLHWKARRTLGEMCRSMWDFQRRTA